jgi:hypothetical protein
VAFFGVVRAAIEGEGLTVSPPISELTLEPGTTVKKTIRLTNPTLNVVEVYPQVMNFKAAGEGGEPTFYSPEDESSKYSLAEWISFNQSKIALAQEQIVEFDYEIKVPENAEPGGHYGVVFFATEPPKNESGASQVALSSMVGALVLVRVPGEIVESGVVESFLPTKKIYFSHKELGLVSRITNLGNVHFKPLGNVDIKNIFGKKVNELTFNEKNGNVLPASTRKFENSWEASPWSAGPYRAGLNVAYGESKQSLIASTVFWVIPWWLIVIFVVVVVLVIYLVFRKRNKGTRLPRKVKKQNMPQPPQRPDIPQNQNPPSGPILR